MKYQKVFFVTLLVFNIYVCINSASFGVNDVTDDAEDQAAKDVPCFFKVFLKGCSGPKRIGAYVDDTEASFTKVINGSTACLQAHCIAKEGKLSLENNVQIRGEFEEADPDWLEKGIANQIYEGEKECLRSQTQLVTITCNEKKEKQVENPLELNEINTKSIQRRSVSNDDKGIESQLIKNEENTLIGSLEKALLQQNNDVPSAATLQEDDPGENPEAAVISEDDNEHDHDIAAALGEEADEPDEEPDAILEEEPEESLKAAVSSNLPDDGPIAILEEDEPEESDEPAMFEEEDEPDMAMFEEDDGDESEEDATEEDESNMAMFEEEDDEPEEDATKEEESDDEDDDQQMLFLKQKRTLRMMTN